MTPSPNNLAVVAAAGSGKTEYIVNEALGAPDTRRVLITTYTTRNCDEIMGRVKRDGGCKPANVAVQGWFSFVMNQAARPYQAAVTGQIDYGRSLDFKGSRPRYVARANWRAYYFNHHRDFRRDHVSELAFRANEATGGLVIRRLEALYDEILIDEFQDLSGYDLNFLDLLFKSNIRVILVGDPRQHTYSTTNSSKNRQHVGDAMMGWLKKRATAGTLKIESRSESWRCNQAICDWADALYPRLSPTTSRNQSPTGHDGIFLLSSDTMPRYAEKFSPVVLRWQKNSNTQGLTAINIGESKGSTCDRVLVATTATMRQYIRSRDPSCLTHETRAKLYVAVTRARHSVALEVDPEDATYVP